MKKTLVLLAALLATGNAHPDQPLGRLFFTEGEREALDARRRARVPDKPAAAPAVASPVTRLDGFVKRSSGPDTVWVNGEPLPQNVQPGERRVAVPLGETGVIQLKPGESLDRGSGEVRDVIGDGEIRIRRGAPR
ncbi:MAG TPA: hypothetical protein VFC18_15025 [Burkholderiales bacterium]|nr:hypothetical protein [Burkholderiales bacterium]